MRFIIDCLYLLAIIVISPKIIYRMISHNRYCGGWPQRLGNINRKFPDKHCIWIHAVSVGEVNATKTLVEKFHEKLPNFEIIISSTTDTGYSRAKALYGKNLSVFYFPFDLSVIMKRAFDNLKPDICILMELEIWPNMSEIARRKGIPVVVVNGRLSDRSYPRYKLIRPITKWMFSKATMILTQTEEYAHRFRSLGCKSDKVIVTNSLKYDTAQITDTVEGVDTIVKQLNIGNEQIWTAGGTGPGEEKIILGTFKRLKKQKGINELRLVIVPRKPERFNDVANLIKQSGFSYIRYSVIKNTQTPLQNKPEIILCDTMGDLKKFYSLATVVFVGRSLVKMGGSDMMEPTALGKCTIFGPYTFNFKQTVKALLDGVGAIEVADQQELFDITLKCLTNEEFAQAIAQNGRKVIIQNRGATEKTVYHITNLLQET